MPQHNRHRRPRGLLSKIQRFFIRLFERIYGEPTNYHTDRIGTDDAADHAEAISDKNQITEKSDNTTFATKRFGFSRLSRKKKMEGPVVIDPHIRRKDPDYVGPELPSIAPESKRHHRRPFWKRIKRSIWKKKKKEIVPFAIKPIDDEFHQFRWRLSRNAFLTINSFMAFIIAFIATYLIYQLAVIVVASRFGITGVLYYYQVFWPIGDSSPLWFPSIKIILITFAGPLASLIIGLISYNAIVPRVKSPMSRLFFLWVSLHGFNLFFGALVAGVITNKGFGYVVNWMYMHVAFKILMAMLFFFILVFIGYYSARIFLETSPQSASVKPNRRSAFLFYQALLPFMIGILFLYLIRLPHNPPYEQILLFTMGASIVPGFFNYKAKPNPHREGKGKTRKFKFLYFLIFIVLLFLFRWVLSFGLHFVIRFYISISRF